MSLCGLTSSLSDCSSVSSSASFGLSLFSSILLVLQSHEFHRTALKSLHSVQEGDSQWQNQSGEEPLDLLVGSSEVST